MGDILIYQKTKNNMSKHTWLSVVSTWKETEMILRGKHVSLILIHLEKEDDSGMHLALKIREMRGCYFTPIIFLAGDDSFLEEAFHTIHCYDYIIKPFCEADLIRVIYPFIHLNYIEPEVSQLSFRIHGRSYIVNVDDIIYMQCVNRNVEVHTVNGVLEVPYLNLKKCLGRCSNELIQCHRSIVVNRMYIREVDFVNKKIELMGTKVEIGRHFLGKIRTELC